ncbi:MAG: LPS export ABC transporter permease LptF [Gammaproteobacteria bacterium]|nr:LPS export ABC transporter permease LptF [Gammaproteobacteria bacterium]
MIIERYLLKEITLNFLSVLAVILLIFGGHHFVRFMEHAASGSLPVEYIFKILFVFILAQMMLLLPGAMFIAFLVSLGRFYRDYEMTAMFACGVGLPRLLRSLVLYALVFSLIVGVMSIWVAPWAERTTRELRFEASLVAEFNALTPGRFHPISKNRGVFYLEKTTGTEGLERVFVFLETERGMEAFSAKRGRRENNAQGDFLVLEDGSLLQRNAKEDSWALLRYGDAQLRLQTPMDAGQLYRVREKRIESLFDEFNRKNIAELYWRFSIPFASVILLILAVFVSKSEPRQGRFGKLFFAILIYIFYIYGMIMSKNWLRSDTVPLLPGIVGLHMIFVVATITMAWRQLGIRLRGVA